MIKFVKMFLKNQLERKPPSIGKETELMKLDSSLSRNSIAFTTSSTSEMN